MLLSVNVRLLFFFVFFLWRTIFLRCAIFGSDSHFRFGNLDRALGISVRLFFSQKNSYISLDKLDSRFLYDIAYVYFFLRFAVVCYGGNSTLVSADD